MSERIERLINRQLDGEITADERAELDRELLRHPGARELLESYTAIDAVAARVVAECAERGAGPRLVMPPVDGPSRARGRRRSWMWYASGLAACLALIIIWRTPPLQSPQPGPGLGTPDNGVQVASHDAARQSPAQRNLRPIPVVGGPGEEAGVWRVADYAAPEVDRVTNRNVIYLSDDEGNIYMINLDYVRELQKPRNRSGIQFTGDPI